MNEVCPEVKNPYSSSSVDRAVHIWANKGTNFKGNVYAEDYKFKEAKNIDTQVSILRALLMLDRENTTWYLTVAQNIISSFPGIERYLSGNIFSKKPNQLELKQSPVLDGLSVVNDGNKYSSFKAQYDTYFPIPQTYTITWSSDDFVGIDNGLGLFSHVPVKITSTYGDPKQFLGYTLLRGNWGDTLPYKGTFKHSGLWSLGSKATIEYTPISIDYKTWVDEIEAASDIGDLITRTGIFENYSLAKEPLEKLALLYASLYIDYSQKLIADE